MEKFLKTIPIIVTSISSILNIFEKLVSLFQRKNDPPAAGKQTDESSSGNQQCQ